MSSKKIRRWLDAGLIREDQAQAILEYEKSHHRPLGLYAAISIGILSIALGLISLIAANWDDIPPSMKIGTFFLTYAMVGGTIVWASDQKDILCETARGLFFGMTIAGIGLIAQVFHIPSNGWGGCMFWVTITLPLTLLSNQRFQPVAWWIAYFTTTILWAANSPTPNEENKAVAMALLILSPGLISPLFSQAKNGLFAPFRHALSPFVVMIFWFLIPLSLDLLAHDGGPSGSEGRWSKLGMTFIGLGVAYGALVQWTARESSHHDRLLQTASLALPLMLLGFSTLSGHVWGGEILGALQFMTVMAVASACANRLGMYKVFNLLTLCIAVRLIVIYFQVFGSLLSMGFGLVLSGVVILAIVYGWYKLRAMIITKPRGHG